MEIISSRKFRAIIMHSLIEMWYKTSQRYQIHMVIVVLSTENIFFFQL